MGRAFKRIVLLLVAAFVAVQFYRPHKNTQRAVTLDDFLIAEKAPKGARSIFTNACYDCHSNKTNYVWYNHIAPISWYVDDQIKRGKSELNFSNWAAMDYRDRRSALSKIAVSIDNGTMPVRSYVALHKSAALSNSDKNQVMKWLYSIEVKN